MNGCPEVRELEPQGVRTLSHRADASQIPRLRPVLIRITVPRTLLILVGALPRQRRLDALLLARLQIECVTLDVLDDVLLQDLSLEAFERALQTFAVL